MPGLSSANSPFLCFPYHKVLLGVFILSVSISWPTFLVPTLNRHSSLLLTGTTLVKVTVYSMIPSQFSTLILLSQEHLTWFIIPSMKPCLYLNPGTLCSSGFLSVLLVTPSQSPWLESSALKDLLGTAPSKNPVLRPLLFPSHTHWVA